MRAKRELGKLLVPVLFAVVLVFGMAGAPADEEIGNLPGGTGISVAIDTPADGALIGHPPGDVSLTGTASIGETPPQKNTTLAYVMDLSGSTAVLPGCGGDQNGDGDPDDVVDCEIASLKALNQQAIDAQTVDEVGLVIFASSAEKADVDPTPGEQNITGPETDNDLPPNGQRDIEEVLVSADSTAGGDGTVAKFTPKNVGNLTNFEAAVQQACSLVQQSTNPTNIVAFLSDGVATEGGNALDDLPCSPTDAVFQTFAVGAESDCDNTGDGRGSLRQIAEATGGTCTQVTDPSQLPELVPGIIESMLTMLDLSVDGGAPQDISGTANPPLPQTGPAMVTYATTAPGLAPGIHSLCVTARGTDHGGQGSVTDCHQVTVANITLTPPSASNELGPGATHTVTATVAAGADGGVAGVDVSFEVVSGPNAGQMDSGTTDANGQASFTYPAKQGPDGIGTDVIQACFTDSQGDTFCDRATKEWRDTTPPRPACTETTNPAGKVVPPAGSTTLPGDKGGQNEDGYYEISATDAVDPNPQVFVRDTGSGTVFGPFASGTRIKYTQAPGGKPSQKKIGSDGDAVQWHITGTGDAAVFAVDASGNQSADVSCKVPPPPK